MRGLDAPDSRRLSECKGEQVADMAVPPEDLGAADR